MFREISSKDFPPFGKFQLKLPPVKDKPTELAEVHLFTGVNGTGKTRFLCVLSAMLGHSEPLNKRVKSFESPLHFYAHDTSPVSKGSPIIRSGLPRAIASSEFEIFADQGQWLQLGTLGNWAQKVPAFAYSGVAYIADASITVMADVPKPERAACLAFSRLEDHSGKLLQAITNVKIQAAMDTMHNAETNEVRTHSTHIISALESTISEITGFPFSFVVTSYPKATVQVRWAGKKLAFNSLPDGLRSIIGWLAHSVVMMDVWLQGKQNPLIAHAVFLLDEVEASLHPAWQRKILPAFQRLFPNAQIFMATHSPFVISSLNHGWIHPLSMKEDGSVKVEQSIPASSGDSYISVVEEIMGVREWYDPETERMLATFRKVRDAAYQGDVEAKSRASQLALEIGTRSMELNFVMGRELKQMERQLSKGIASK